MRSQSAGIFFEQHAACKLEGAASRAAASASKENDDSSGGVSVLATRLSAPLATRAPVISSRPGHGLISMFAAMPSRAQRSAASASVGSRVPANCGPYHAPASSVASCCPCVVGGSAVAVGCALERVVVQQERAGCRRIVWRRTRPCGSRSVRRRRNPRACFPARACRRSDGRPVADKASPRTRCDQSRFPRSLPFR